MLLNDVLRPSADADTTVPAGAASDIAGRPASAADVAGPSSSGPAQPLAAGAAPTVMDVDGAGPPQPAAASAGDVEAAAGAQQQPWTPEQQAERWAAAERASAAAAASGTATQQARLAMAISTLSRCRFCVLCRWVVPCCRSKADRAGGTHSSVHVEACCCRGSLRQWNRSQAAATLIIHLRWPLTVCCALRYGISRWILTATEIADGGAGAAGGLCSAGGRGGGSRIRR